MGRRASGNKVVTGPNSAIQRQIGLAISERLSMTDVDPTPLGFAALSAASEFLLRDIPSVAELESVVFDFVHENDARSAIAGSFYSARWMGKVGLLLDRDPRSPGHAAHVRAQLFELRSTVEGCLFALIRLKGAEPGGTLHDMIEQARQAGMLSSAVLSHASAVRLGGNRVHTEVERRVARPRAEGDSRVAYMATLKLINGCRTAAGLAAWPG